MFRTAIIALLAITFVGCSDNNENADPNNIKFDRDQGQQTNGEMTDMGRTVDMNEPTDVAEPTDTGGEIDFTVQAAGAMHGQWVATRTDGGDEIAKLHLRHEAGESSIIGNFEMTDPVASGRIGGSNFLTNTFTTSWTVQIDGIDRRFGLAMCASDGDVDLYNCQHSDPLTGSIVDATLTRQAF